MAGNKEIEFFNKALSEGKVSSSVVIDKFFFDKPNYLDVAFWHHIKVPVYRKGKRHKAPRKWKKEIFKQLKQKGLI